MPRIPFGPVPLVLLAAFLVALWIFGRRRWSRTPLAILALLALVAASLLVLGLSAERHEGAYRPAHIENGRIVPGEMK